MYVDDNNSEEITTKENWELVFDVDMNRIFRPRYDGKHDGENQPGQRSAAESDRQKTGRRRRQPEEQHNSGGGMGMGMGSMGGMGSMIGR